MPAASLPEDATKFLAGCVGEGWTAQPLLGDASTRQYFRIRLADGTTRILAYYSPELQPQLRRFLQAYRIVSPHARVPRVVCDSESCVLQEDVGDRTLYDLLHADRDEGVRRYGQAVDLMLAFRSAGTAAVNPPFDAAFFFAELEMTREFYAVKLMGVTDTEPLVPLFRKLADNVSRHRYVLCHRDFHGQNLHVFDDVLYMIDYQDMRMGPDTYDLASLLRDRGVAGILGDAERQLLAEYLAHSGTPMRDYYETLLQRSIKILGTFARQPIERGRLHYLDFIPATLESVACCLRELPEFAALQRFFPTDFPLDATRERLKGTFDGHAQDHAPAR